MLPSGARTVIFLQYHAATLDGGASLKYPCFQARCSAARAISML